MESKFLHKDGHHIHALLKSIPPTTDGPGIEREHLEGFVVDITDRVFLEKSLVHREKLKTLGAISAEVAHEIRNPLMSIGGFAKRLKQKFPDMHECDIILKESQRLEKILSRIRNYLEPVEIHPKECSVYYIVSDCLNLLSPEMDKKQVVCNVNIDMELPSVYADPEVLTQIFINLIRNATSAISDGGILTINSYETDQDIRMDFNNRAEGIQFSHPETLFMPFSEGGQSFGLPLCYRLVKDMGGLLSFSQEKDNVTFTVSFPKRSSYAEPVGLTEVYSEPNYFVEDTEHTV
jgi:signal transduction histidine kinase